MLDYLSGSDTESDSTRSGPPTGIKPPVVRYDALQATSIVEASAPASARSGLSYEELASESIQILQGMHLDMERIVRCR